ncbi:MAG TPA: hypothetical protein VF107_06760, partial [Burkholderiaceae bacterium]
GFSMTLPSTITIAISDRTIGRDVDRSRARQRSGSSTPLRRRSCATVPANCRVGKVLNVRACRRPAGTAAP